MNYRPVAQLGVILTVATLVTALLFPSFRETVLPVFGVSIAMTMFAWGLKEPSSPPASFAGWVLTGNTIPYSEMNDRQLKSKVGWMWFKYTKKSGLSGASRRLLGFQMFDKCTVDELESELEEAMEEVESREMESPLPRKAEF